MDHWKEHQIATLAGDDRHVSAAMDAMWDHYDGTLEALQRDACDAAAAGN